jgi:16S rRNA (guanine(966)-N(2))-methyltransferase RsmD
MRVISGSARGRNLISPNSSARPTSDKVKEAIFSSLQFDLQNARILDLFAGSGQLGIEALSRGADFSVFCECDRNTVTIILKNLKNCGFMDNSKVHNIDARNFISRCEEKFDIILLDPPYNYGILEEILPNLHSICKENAKIVCEHEKSLLLPESFNSLKLQKKHIYSNIAVTTFVNTINNN